MTGAELTLAMVDLDFDERTRFYHAPPQVKANNGLFILDDLGRQLVTAQDLMNRWIVPLDRRIDYLALHTGQKFMVPFDVIVVFSSNLRPAAAGRRGFPAPARLQDPRRRAGPVRVSRDLPAGLRADRHSLRRRRARSRARAPSTARRGPCLLACPRDVLGQVQGLCALPRREARNVEGPPRLGVGQLFREDVTQRAPH